MKIIQTLLMGTALISSSFASGDSDDDLTDVRMPPCLVRMSEVQTIINTIEDASDICSEYWVGEAVAHLSGLGESDASILGLIRKYDDFKKEIKQRDKQIDECIRLLNSYAEHMFKMPDCIEVRVCRFEYAVSYRKTMALIYETQSYKQLARALKIRIGVLDKSQILCERFAEELELQYENKLYEEMEKRDDLIRFRDEN